MIDVMENKILGPAIRQGLAQGRQEGRHEGEQGLLKRQLVARFGSLPAWVEPRLAAASTEELNRWAERILTSPTLEATLSAS